MADDLYDDDSYDDLYDSEVDPELVRFAEVLASVDRPGDFCASGSLGGWLPLVEVSGFGPIPLPFPEMLLKALAVRGSPVSKGWRIAASGLVLAERIWGPLLASLRRRVAAGLGIEGEVRLELRELLICPAGAPLAASRGSKGSFGTLVLALPSQAKGGELLVEHQGHRRELSLSSAHLDELAWAATYSACAQEARPVASGVRVALVFDLCRRGGALPPLRHEAVEAVADGLERCFAEAAPTKLVCLLDAGGPPSWDQLEGADAARADALRAAAEARGMKVRLGRVSLLETWSAAAIYARRRWSEPEPDDVELYDLVDKGWHVDGLLDAAGKPSELSALPVFEHEVCPPDALDETPDEFDFEESGWDEPGTATRAWYRTAIVVWPAENEIAVLGQAGAKFLWEALAQARADGAADRVRALAGRLASTVRPGRLLRPTWEVALELDLLDSIPALLFGSTGYEGVDDDVLGLAAEGLARLALRDAEAASRGLHPVLCGHRTSLFSAVRLLAALVEAGAPRSLLDDGLQLWLERFTAAPAWQIRWDDGAVEAVLRIAATLGAHERVAPALETADFDAALVPAVVALVRAGILTRDGSWAARVRDQVSERASEDLTPPADQAREAPQGCRCEHCAALGRFLVSPTRTDWTYPVRKEIRRHLYQVIERQRLDAQAHTIRQGRPYKFVVTKTRARYEARVAQREIDLETLRVLG